MTDDKGAGEGPYKYEQGSILGLDHNPCLAYHPSVEHYVECLNEAYATGRKAERERWAKILAYAQHRDSCGDMDAHNNADAPSCNCGLDGLKDEIRGGQDAK